MSELELVDGVEATWEQSGLYQRNELWVNTISYTRETLFLS
jgi:hypothetical protein